jgi:hypothetical protein
MGSDKSWEDLKNSQKAAKSRRERQDAKYKRRLDKLFTSDGEVPDEFKEMMGDIGPEEGSAEAERRDAIQTLRDADGFREFAKAVNNYVSRDYALPDDENLLVRMLDHPDNDIVALTLAHLVELSDRRDLERITPLKSRLSTIRTMTDDSRIRELVDTLEDRL